MRRHALRVVVGLLIGSFAPPALAQCSPTGSGSPGSGPDYVYLQPNAAMNAQSSTAVSGAVSSWRTCYSPGQQMGFPIPTTNPISGASFASINVQYLTGYNPNNTSSCGSFSGNTIKIFQQAYTPTGHTVQCSSYGYQFLIAHEMGHFYKMADVMGSGCSSIMSQADGFAHSVTSADCTVAKQQTQTPSENNTTYPTCQEPCAGNCNNDGTCAATFPSSPIVIALNGNRFALTGLEDPVLFDLKNDGQPSLIGWTRRGGDTAFLALDRNGNGLIENGGELFGNRTFLLDGSVAANGFTALSEYDAALLGGNGDLQIDAGDAIYSSLRLWLDHDHDGLTDAGELTPLASHGIISISLEYRLSRRTDRFGNLFWLRGSAMRATRNGKAHPIVIYDVSFVRE